MAPQEIHQLRAEAEQAFGSKLLFRKLSHIWSAPFSVAEQVNRKSHRLSRPGASRTRPSRRTPTSSPSTR